MNDTNNVRMWICETDRYGATDNKFCVDNPVHIPRVGEFIDSDDASGYVTHVQYHYKTRNHKIDESETFSLVIMVYLGEKQ